MDNDNEISRDEDTTDYESDSDASQKAPVTEADPAGIEFEFKKIGKEVTKVVQSFYSFDQEKAPRRVFL